MEIFSTLLTAPAIIAVVNLLKRYGLSSNWAPIVSVVLGGLFGVVVVFATGLPMVDLPTTIMMGIVAGLTASGGYDVAATIGNHRESSDFDDQIIVLTDEF